MQKAQKLLLSAVCAILKACETVTGDVRTTLTHALVLAMSSNREINLRRRDALRPHLNSQYSALCNPSTPITTSYLGMISPKKLINLQSRTGWAINWLVLGKDVIHVFTRMGPKQREATCSIRDRILGPISLFSETEAPIVGDQEPKWVRPSQRS